MSPRSVVVGYATSAALARALAGNPAIVVRRLPQLHAAEVQPLGRIGRFAARLRGAPGIRYVEPTAARTVAAEPALGPSFVRAGAWEWQYAATHADAVPDSVLRAAASITLAVVDTGADVAAPDLAAKSPAFWSARGGALDDPNGHGTFVASLAAGSTTNGDGIAGFGGDVRLLVVRAARSDGTVTDVDEAAALTYAADHGARVINLSLGGPTTSTTERRAIDYAVARGALIVAAAGNEYKRGNPVEYPAALLQPRGSNGRLGRGLSVGASNSRGTRASFSNTGSYISLAAPGQDVFGALSALSSPRTYPRVALPGSETGLYGYASGTSFAAPQVAGAAALVWAANPALTAWQVAAVLQETASGGGVWTPSLGYGVIDVAAAVAAAPDGASLLGVHRIRRPD